MEAGHAYDTGSFIFITSTTILVLAYAFIISERVNRAVLALLGAGFMVTLGVINQEQAYEGVDWNTIFLLCGMMMLVGVTRRCGVFQYVAILAAKIARANPGGMIALLSIVTAVFSALLDNVTTVLLVVPVTLAICSELRVPAYPFLFTEILASNIGGTATLIGDPPNILIGSAVGLSFMDFVYALAPVVVVILIVQMGINHVIWGRRLRAKPEDRARVLAMDENKAITDYVLLVKSLIVLTGVIFAFALAHTLGLEPGTIAMFGAAILLLLDNIGRPIDAQAESVTEVFHEVEWITLFFFVGLFIIVTGVEHAGLLQLLADEMLSLTDGDMRVTALAILWSSAVLSAIVDNIPFVATMIPLIENLGPAMGGKDALMPLWWSLSLGACLGGNGSLIGASANLTVAGIAERNGVPFRFVTFFLYAFPMMILSILIAHVYVELVIL